MYRASFCYRSARFCFKIRNIEPLKIPFIIFFSSWNLLLIRHWEFTAIQKMCHSFAKVVKARESWVFALGKSFGAASKLVCKSKHWPRRRCKRPTAKEPQRVNVPKSSPPHGKLGAATRCEKRPLDERKYSSPTSHHWIGVTVEEPNLNEQMSYIKSQQRILRKTVLTALREHGWPAKTFSALYKKLWADPAMTQRAIRDTEKGRVLLGKKRFLGGITRPKNKE